jgi:hypothetical protein
LKNLSKSRKTARVVAIEKKAISKGFLEPEAKIRAARNRTDAIINPI